MKNRLDKIKEIYATLKFYFWGAPHPRSLIKASTTNLEKLSIFYGVGADASYDIDEINEERRLLIMDTAKIAKEIELKSKGQRNKVNDFKEMFENISFEETRSKFMFAMKMLLASANHAETAEDFKIAYDIN